MTERRLVLGIGNVLLGDEGVGVEVVRALEQRALPEDVTCLDGGTGGFALLGPLLEARQVILVDATVDDRPVGSLQRLEPRFARDYPRTLTAHDIGLKDLLDAFYLLGQTPRVTLFAISVEPPQELDIGLSAALQERLPEIVETVAAELYSPRNRITSPEHGISAPARV